MIQPSSCTPIPTSLPPSQALRRFGRSLLPLLLLASVTNLRAQQTLSEGPLPAAEAPARATLNNDAIIRMSKAGLDTSLILQTIRTQPGQYSTSADDLIALKDAGVPQPVIAAMLAHGSGLVAHPAEPAAVTVSPLSPGVDEDGVYHKDNTGKWVEISPELVHYRSGGWVKSTLTHDIVKKDRNGEVSGGQSPLVLQPGDQLLIVAPPNTDPIEYQLLRFRLHPNSREFRVSTGGVFNSHDDTDRDQVQVHATRLEPRIFSLTIPQTIGGGEFGVLPPGNASTPGIAFAGKIYTFAITVNK